MATVTLIDYTLIPLDLKESYQLHNGSSLQRSRGIRINAINKGGHNHLSIACPRVPREMVGI